MTITRAQEYYLWPPKCELKFFRKDRQGVYWYVMTSTDRFFDLVDNITPEGHRTTRTIYMAMTTESTRWRTWNLANVEGIERRIRSDLGSDGYRVSIRRLTPVDDGPCTEEFLWRLVIR